MEYYQPPYHPHYVYAPIPIPSQDFYAVYPSMEQYYFRNDDPKIMMNSSKMNRKDSGISEASGMSSRKTSTDSQLSQSSMPERKFSSVAESSEEEKAEPPFVEPDEDLVEKIIQQVEFYFSDANITKDKFLLKHVKRNKEGFVSLKLISSFKRVKHLTKDWRQVAFALRSSTRLEVNDLQTKVRRLDVLPEYDETTPSRTVVVLSLPLERPTIEAVAEIFSAIGEIALIRILRPGNPTPGDIKQYMNKHPEMMNSVCALVEFERTQYAINAVNTMNGKDGMQVIELTQPASKATKNQSERKVSRKETSGLVRKISESQMKYESQDRKKKLSFSGTTNAFQSIQKQRKSSLQFTPKFNFEDNKENSHQMKKEKKKSSGSEFTLNPSAPPFQMQQKKSVVSKKSIDSLISPWVSRRMSSAKPNDATKSGLTLPSNVIRIPKGPDGTKGFNTWCRIRMQADHSGSTATASPQCDFEAATAREESAIPAIIIEEVETIAAGGEPTSPGHDADDLPVGADAFVSTSGDESTAASTCSRADSLMEDTSSEADSLVIACDDGLDSGNESVESSEDMSALDHRHLNETERTR